MVTLDHVVDSKNKLVKDVHRVRLVGFQLEDSKNGGFMIYHNSK